ncbi:hypothetical protein Pmar_PMAR025138 [Perkinsus marinus ATCC 50983]|uniref:Uncharacterized protein n=1 Tax=Perkinsus marinus (strain ATCC 50983 / TXsc) TaxID=423536 RepID=C5LQJ3_PERM5|nr:hypothetical protein Pmar_PMAR025138 [Perkinsus marinus ATCC 50983]EER01039.1 hypothetical protein Pmar_PMAR025138 [Perkinsus marinus ATCC 50983]|eukprot:XP_002768321.1 hypothetical protein Pmar_PMAR025138 [Perkinsus marinus ATCC 50983]
MRASYGKAPDATHEELKDVLMRTGYCTGIQAKLLLEKLPVILVYLFDGDEVTEYSISDVAAAVCQIYEQEDEFRQEVAEQVDEPKKGPCPYPTSEYGFDLHYHQQGSVEVWRRLGDQLALVDDVDEEDRPRAPIACRAASPERSVPRPWQDMGSGGGVVSLVTHETPPESTTRTGPSGAHRGYVPVPTGRLDATSEKLWESCCCDARMLSMGKEAFEIAIALALSKGYRLFRAKRDEPAREEYSARQHGLRKGMLLVLTKADNIWAWGYALDDPKCLKYFPVDGHRVDEICMG